MNNDSPNINTEQKVILAVRHHLRGIRKKVLYELSEQNYTRELQRLQGDPVYNKIGFDCPEYVLIRFMGRISISMGRRLGEIYDKLPRFLAAARFSLSCEQVEPIIRSLKLDMGLDFRLLSTEDKKHVKARVAEYLPGKHSMKGVGIEIRYNFNPNDSARLRKDVSMAEGIIDLGWIPIYLVFSGISPRDEAIARLKRAGWHFLVGQSALDFSYALLGVDIISILDHPTFRSEIRREINSIMDLLFDSYAFKTVLRGRHST